MFGCSPQDEQGCVAAIVGMRCQQFLESLNQIRTTLAHIRDLLRHEKHDFQLWIRGESQLLARFAAISGTKHHRVNGIGDAHHLMPLRQTSHLRLFAQPTTAGYKCDVPLSVNLCFALPHLVRQIVVRRLRKQRTVPTLIVKAHTILGIVTNARHWPQIVHRPHHALSALENVLQSLEGEPTLINPMQMNHIGRLKFGARSDVCACVGDVYRKKSFARKAQMKENHESFPEETPLEPPTTVGGINARVASGTIAHQHCGLHAIGAESIHKSMSRHGRTSCGLAGVYNENFHPSENSISDKSNQKCGIGQIKCVFHNYMQVRTQALCRCPPTRYMGGKGRGE